MSARPSAKTALAMANSIIGTTLKLALFNGGTLSSTVEFMSGVDGTELATTLGYTSGFAGRLTLTGETITDDANGATVDCNDLVVAALGAGSQPITKAVLYKPGTSDADSRVIAQYDCAATLTGLAVTFTIHASGLVRIAV